ncbi:MAG: HAMP domain-containing histidine kinase [Clostridia bacterium]|nr:HAMP domain-containing histidine kinase [Clostridia bacterium]
MKRYYRSRLILISMFSGLVLLILAVIGIWLFSYQRMEWETDAFISAMQQAAEQERPALQSAPPPMFGYAPDPRRYPSSFYDIELDENGSIQSIQRFGIMEEAEISVQQYVQQAVKEQASSGKTGSYKYSITYRDDGTARVIILDISIQLQALYNILKSALLVGTVLMIILFLILLPVSSRVADAFLRNNEKQQQFITDAGHDLKTPVAIIRSNLDVLELQGKSKWSENIRSQTIRLEQLIEQLLMLSRLDETKTKIKYETLNLTDIIREEKQHFLQVTERRKIQWQDSLPDDLCVSGEEKAIRQMLNLLMDNAAQYTNDAGQIILSGYTDRKKTVFQLSNTVDSLPGQKPEELTERFVRGNTARTQKSGGSGIGLSAVERIIKILNGNIRITYPDEHTFCVTMEMPRANQSASHRL